MWAKPIKDDGVACFIAFATRMCELHGYDTAYFLHKDDLVRMVNKRSDGVEDWLRSFECIDTNIKIGQIYEHVIIFSIPEPIRLNPLGGRKRNPKFADYELTDIRQQMVWMYLLGCLNQNLIGDKDYEHLDADAAKYNKNTFGIKEFNIDREAAGYIKKLDR